MARRKSDVTEKTFPEVIGIDLIAGDAAPSTAISVERLSTLRTHGLVQENATVRATRHVIIVPESGVGRHVVEMKTYTIEPGSVLHIEAGQSHRWLPEEAFDGWAIGIDQHLCAPGLFDIPAPHPLVLLGTSIDVAHALITSLTAPEVLPEGAQRRLRLSMASVLLELLAAASGRAGLNTETVAEHKIVGDFRRELEFHYLSTRSVVDYAAMVGCSTKTLTRATNAVLGQTPKEVIDRRVAFAACRLLANTDISVSWIAHKLGFTEQSNFSKFFNRKVEMTPAAYRASCAADRGKLT